ncbi:MAG: M23 family metallopeptidase [Henriciella sp.]|nr:M23 family metallopeptidase [Henriciella sp.]
MTSLDTSVLLIQIALPIALLLWLAIAPARSGLRFAVQSISIAAILLALAVLPIWLIPPWWVPWAYMAIAAGLVARGYLRRQDQSRAVQSYSRKGWIALAPLAMLGVYAAFLCIGGFSGRTLGAYETVDLPPPLGAGTYLVANGGSRGSVNGHFLTLDPRTDRQRAYRGQSFALDLVKIDGTGMRVDGWRPRDPSRYFIFGAPVTSPCAGKVIAAENTHPDMPVPEPDRSRLEGNHVFLDCGAFGVLLAHLQQGSVLVEAGDTVEIGTPLGKVGNSGQTFEPHLHIHVQSLASEGYHLSGDPLQLTLNGDFLVRNQRFKIAPSGS